MTRNPVSGSTAADSYLYPDRNLGMELVRATEAAAIRSAPFIGKGDKNTADGAAVDAMRKFLDTVAFDGVVVIGEGEKDEAPMLFNGENVGNGSGPSCDVAVDPIDGTSLTAAGRMNALSVIAVNDKGTMSDPSAVFYMDKIVTGPEGRGVVDLNRPIGENITALAAAKGIHVEDMQIAVLDRPRHGDLIRRSTPSEHRRGCFSTVTWRRHQCRPPGLTYRYVCRHRRNPGRHHYSLCREGLGRHDPGRLAPKNDAEQYKALDAGHDLHRVLDQDDLVRGDNVYFVATGVTDGALVAGVQRTEAMIRTSSIVLRSHSGTIRRVEADHLITKWYGES